MNKLSKRYPLTSRCRDGDIELKLFTGDHRAAMQQFAQSLPEHDLLFLKRNIREDKVLDAWINSVETGEVASVIACRGDTILGCNSLIIDKWSWSSHVGEVRVLVDASMRKQGLGRLLIQECFIAGLLLGLEKLIAKMTVDQDTAITVFEEMGFTTEALLKDHVRSQSGEKYDLLMMGQDVEQFQSRKEMYGVNEAF
jgi:GNAT superfamily N-acetyltransferase